MHRLSFAGLLWLTTFASAVFADDSWPQWQGPNRNNLSQETGLLDHWDGAPPLLWQSADLGSGYSGVVVANGIVCTVADRNERMEVVGLDAESGKVVWRADIDKAFNWGSAYPGCRSTPTIAGDHFYALSPPGRLVCGSVQTGKMLWERHLVEDFGGDFVGGWGYTESMLVDGDKLVFSPGGGSGSIFALDKNTGDKIWNTDPLVHGAMFCSMVISEGAGVKQYIQRFGDGTLGVDAETGKKLWFHLDRGAGTSVTPIVRENYILNCGGNTTLLKLVKSEKEGDAFEAQEVYKIKEITLGHGSFVAVGDYVYFGEPQPMCIEFSTGKLMWSGPEAEDKHPERNSASIIHADGNLYIYRNNGVMEMVRATPEKFDLRGRFQVPAKASGGENFSRPALCNGRLFVRCAGAIYCYDLKKK